MGYLPSNPHFAVVNCKIGDLNLTPIPPNVLEEFTYERTTQDGRAGKVTFVVHDETAVVMESYIADGNRDLEFSYGYNDGEMSDSYTVTMTEYSIDFDASGARLTIEGVSEPVVDDFVDPKSVTYKNMTIEEIIRSIAEEEGWIINDDSIEPIEDVEESEVYSIATSVAASSTSSFSDAVAGGSGGISDGTIGADQQKIIDCCKSTAFTGTGWCAKWVSMVFSAAGYPYPGGNADDMYYNFCTSTNKADLKPGMIIAVAPSGATGNQYGHVGIYIGNNQVMHNADQVRTDTVDKWISTYGPTGSHPHNNQVKWGWMDNRALA